MQATVEAKLAEKLGISKAEADRIFNATLEALRESIVEDRELRLRGFGTFKTKTKPARTYRNPRTGEPVPKPAKNIVRFNLSSKLDSLINPQTP